MGVKDENNNENKQELDAFDSEPEYFCQVVRPMLKRGHEIELIVWMKEIGLIRNSQICNNSKLNEDCRKNMEWAPAKVNDYYQWKCRNCPEKKSIRENSIFSDVKCSLNNSTRILLGWCKGYNVEAMANILGVKKHVVRSLYGIVTTTARKSLKCHIENQKFGGPGVIVIVDTYPEGCSNYASKAVRGNRPILCLSEVKAIPPNYWFEALDRYSKNNSNHIRDVKDHIVSTIRDIVMPGSILITRLDSTLCSYHDLQCLKSIYPTIVTIEGVSRHDTHIQSVRANLETIWKLALDVCEEAQLFAYDEVPNFLTEQMWHSRFGSESFEMLLNRFTEIVY